MGVLPENVSDYALLNVEPGPFDRNTPIFYWNYAIFVSHVYVPPSTVKTVKKGGTLAGAYFDSSDIYEPSLKF